MICKEMFSLITNPGVHYVRVESANLKCTFTVSTCFLFIIRYILFLKKIIGSIEDLRYVIILFCFNNPNRL